MWAPVQRNNAIGIHEVPGDQDLFWICINLKSKLRIHLEGHSRHQAVQSRFVVHVVGTQILRLCGVFGVVRNLRARGFDKYSTLRFQILKSEVAASAPVSVEVWLAFRSSCERASRRCRGSSPCCASASASRACCATTPLSRSRRRRWGL